MDSANKSDEERRKLLKLVGQYDALVYAAVKQGRVAELPREGQILAKVIQEHLGLPHIHNALEFADVRGGEPYEVDGVSPMAHLKMHAAVEGMLDGGNADVKAAYEKLLATGIERHHAVHIVGAIFLEFFRDAGKEMERGAPLGVHKEFKENLHRFGVSKENGPTVWRKACFCRTRKRRRHAVTCP